MNHLTDITGFSSEIGTKLCDWAVGQAGGSCYSKAALSSNDSKTLYMTRKPPFSGALNIPILHCMGCLLVSRQNVMQ